MASTRSKVPVGSAQWILEERRQADQFVEQEVEEFSFSVRNEMEWLNEHMAEIFSQNELNVADVFKTPGKLRGKTPRTARKRNPLEARAPLTDVFAPNLNNIPSPAHNTQFYKHVSQIQIAEDPQPSLRAPPTAQSPTRSPHRQIQAQKLPTDSGYHDATDDEMDVDAENLPFAVTSSPRKESPRKAHESSPHQQTELEERATEESLAASVRSAGQSRNQSQEDPNDDVEMVHDKDEMEPDEDEMDLIGEEDQGIPPTQDFKQTQSPQYSMGDRTASAMNSVLNNEEEMSDAEEAEAEEDAGTGEPRSPSEGSSPVKPLLRKSSLTFSSLPAREPITAKKSFGNRLSRTSYGDQLKLRASTRGSHYGRYTDGKSLGASQSGTAADTQADEDDVEDADEERPGLPHAESETTKTHNKTSTQRLHERINMLGQSQEHRATKSISSGAAVSDPRYPQLPNVEDEKPTAEETKPTTQSATSAGQDVEDEDDDWIAPVPTTATSTIIKPAVLKPRTDINQARDAGPVAPASGLPLRTSPQRPAVSHSKSSSVPTFESPRRSPERPQSSHLKAVSNSNTPAGSPSGKRYADGPLSASKSKLYSVFKSARNIFASSAGASAQAKIEALSPPSDSKDDAQVPSMEEVFSPLRENLGVEPEIRDTAAPVTLAASPARKHRDGMSDSWSEYQRNDDEGNGTFAEVKAVQEEDHSVEAAVPNGTQKLQQDVDTRSGTTSRADTLSFQDEDQQSGDEMPPPPPKAQPAQKAREQRSKLAKPGKSTLRQPATHIKVGLGSSQIGRKPGTLPTNVDLAQTLQGSFAPPAKAHAEPAATKSFTRSTNAAPVAKPNSLALAAKKKEEEEQKAQEKADRKKRIEQQKAARAAKAEEERRKAEEERVLEAQRKAAEQQRVQEAKRNANRQALALEAKKLEQQRAQASRPQSRANDLQEKQQAMPRGDLAGARPLSRMNTVQDLKLSRPNPPVNPAKPAKRALQTEDDEPVQRPQVQRNGPSFQRLDAKRRKTDEDEESTDGRRSVMAPPIRQSNVRKMYPDRERVMSVMDKAKEPPAKFQHGYMAAPSSSAHPNGGSMFKQAVTTQHQMQHRTPGHPNDMATISKAKIPFADAPSSSAAGPSHYAQNPYKTPMRGTTTTKSVPTASPHFPTPELPEIATDSEDEDSDDDGDAFKAPSWVNSPALRELLAAQQLVDPMEVFGPIPELRMEEIFKNKDRHKRFRDRTSSANWNGNDRLTEEERKRDKDAREKMMKDGGWTFGTAS